MEINCSDKLLETQVRISPSASHTWTIYPPIFCLTTGNYEVLHEL